MIWVTLLAGVLVTCGEQPSVASPGRNRYGFYRDVRAAADGTRRVFGGEPVSAAVFPPAARLTDSGRRTRCSGAVLAPRWTLTAAHCLSSSLVYVEYNASSGQYATVLHLYRHPQYRVIHEDEGRGLDVTLLHHDVGLVRTHTDMILNPPLPDPLLFMRKYNAMDLNTQEVQVLGFGRTEDTARGEQLSSAWLRLTPCARSSWLQCTCGAADGAERGAGSGARGVCAGDSGGPVLYRGRQVGVTSMGPVSCASSAEVVDATSVFTTLHYYVDLLNDTMHGGDDKFQMADDKLRMTRVNSGGSTRAATFNALLTALLVASLTTPPAFITEAIRAVIALHIDYRSTRHRFGRPDRYHYCTLDKLDDTQFLC